MTAIAPAARAQSAADVDRTAAVIGLVRELAAEVHAQDRTPPAPTLASTLDRDLGLDSMARVELLLRVERRFALRLPEDLIGKVSTVGDLVRALDALQPARAAEGEPAVAPLAPGGAAPASAGSLMEALRWHAEREPERLHAVLTDGERETVRVTYGDLERRATRIAGGLAARGLRPGDRAALMLPTGLDFLAGFCGVLLAGGVPVPLYPPPGPARIGDHLAREAGILGNCAARLLIAAPEVRPFTRLLRAQAPGTEDIVDPAALAEGGALPGASSPEGVALLQYTSGSTGRPKGVVLTHANLLANIRAMGSVVGIGRDDVFVSWLPLYHDMGLIGAWLGSLYFGIPLVLMPPLAFLQRPHHWLRAMQRYRGTVSGGPNFAYELCLKRIRDEQLAGLDLASWRFAFNGAEPVAATTLQRFAARYARYGLDPRALSPVYGLAECSVGLTFTPPGRGPRVDRIDRAALGATGAAVPVAPDSAAGMAVVGCGYPLPEHEVRIAGPSDEPLRERREGRIQFRGPSATAGYYGNEPATRALVRDGWLDTGDLGYLAEGELYPTGRVKDLIIRAGRHFHPEELEQAAGRLPGVRQGCVAAFGTTDRATGTEKLVVVAETRETDPARRGALRSAINALAVDFLGAPVEDVVLAPPHAVLKTSSGKVRRAETRLMYERGLLTAGRWRKTLERTRLAATAAAGLARERTRTATACVYAGYAWTVFALCAALTAPLAAAARNLALRQRVARCAARLILRAAGLTPAVHGLDRWPAGPRRIVVVNHASYIDAIVLAATLPDVLRFAAKRDLAASPILRFALRATGAVLVDSMVPEHGVEAADALIEAAEQGGTLVVFAEGTFRRAPGVLPFRLGAFVAAARTGAPVIPVALCGTRVVLPAATWLPRRSPLAVTIGAPLHPSDATFAAAVALRDAAREAIALACREGLSN